MTAAAADLVAYYGRRAPEYDAIYRRPDPARREEQRRLAAAMREALAGRRVLEVACGTGHWTWEVAPAVRALTGVDASEEMLALARRRRLPRRVTLVAGDAWDLGAVPGRFDGGLAAFWLSHVPRARLGEFLDGFHARLEPGSAVVLADNVFVPGLGGELVGHAAEGPAVGPEAPGATPGGGASADTYKLRRLADGSDHRVLKNYLSDAELTELLAPRSRGLAIERGAAFWSVRYRVSEREGGAAVAAGAGGADPAGGSGG